MMGLPLAFATPAILAALALLPAIWWLLRLTPPRPRQVAFPPTRLLAEIARKEETPASSPWWLTLLRLLLAAAVIVALAGPLWRPDARVAAGSGPLALVVDNGWASGRDWAERARAAAAVLDGAQRDARPVILAATADGPDQDLAATSVEVARERLAALRPEPWPTDRAALVSPLKTAFAQAKPGEIVLVSDRVAGRDDGFAGLLAATGAPVVVLSDPAGDPVALTATENGAEALKVHAARLPGPTPPPQVVRALDGKGFELGTATATFAPGATTAEARFDLPTQLRNDIARFEIAGERSAAAVRLVDDRWRRRTVGLLSGAGADVAQPLLSPLHYLSRALAPYADLREPTEPNLPVAIDHLVSEGVSVIALADIGKLTGEAHDELKAWIEKGGVLVRFAGPRLAAGTDDLVPVRLRQGGRVLGGTLSWETPQPLAAFSDTGPFAGLKVPNDVTVERQVLAEPDADLNEHTWASLGDGTPLVTASRLGQGWVVLFHVTADTAWSNLPLSGAFVEMLQRIVAFSTAAGNAKAGGSQPLPPLRVLDGEGRLVPPGPDVQPLAPNAPLDGGVGPAHPPGLYGAETAFRALNLMPKDAVIAPFDLGPLSGARQLDYAAAGPIDLKPWVLGLAMALVLLDGLAVILIAGGPRLRRRAAAAVLAGGLVAAIGLPGPSARAQTDAPAAATPVAADAKPTDAKPVDPKPVDEKALQFAEQATTSTRLAYVVTGNQDIDDESRQGLNGLTTFLAERTALEGGTPIGVDISKDELAFFPLLYWPIDPNAPKPSEATMARIDAYMRNGGTILFDTRDALSNPHGSGTVSPAAQKLREILDGLDIPALEPVPADHVLTKSFYLLHDFPGRYTGSPLWVESLSAQSADSGANPDRPVRSGDGVSPILITGNDFAAAWALTDGGEWAYPTVPADPDQREHAIRAGINIVMYTLTGNYKADQVHVPALLERLGQ